MNLKNFERTCARDGSHGLQGQCGAPKRQRSGGQPGPAGARPT
ncbi:MAG: hypothetical protein NZ529_03145 [Cytophagaceae bacterium]|nr:hypothetical protein [Cytophagaceae bacterium]MDW8455766.1 hypothetical protein [Cytophagaceae bacterium]